MASFISFFSSNTLIYVIHRINYKIFVIFDIQLFCITKNNTWFVHYKLINVNNAHAVSAIIFLILYNIIPSIQLFTIIKFQYKLIEEKR